MATKQPIEFDGHRGEHTKNLQFYRNPALIIGLCFFVGSILIWFWLYKSANDPTMNQSLPSFPVKQGEELSRKFLIRKPEKYFFGVIINPENPIKFKSNNSSLPCDLDVILRFNGETILQTNITELEISMHGQIGLAYELFFTQLPKAGEYDLYIRNNKDIVYQSTTEPSLSISIASPTQVTRLLAYEIGKYLLPLLGFVGIIVIIVGVFQIKNLRRN